MIIRFKYMQQCTRYTLGTTVPDTIDSDTKPPATTHNAMSSACVDPRSPKRQRVTVPKYLEGCPPTLLRYIFGYLENTDALRAAGALRCTSVALRGVFSRGKVDLSYSMGWNIPHDVDKWIQIAEPLLIRLEVNKLTLELACQLNKLRLVDLVFSSFDTAITDDIVLTFPPHLTQLGVSSNTYNGTIVAPDDGTDGSIIAPKIKASTWEHFQDLRELNVYAPNVQFKDGVLQNFKKLHKFYAPDDCVDRQISHMTDLHELFVNGDNVSDAAFRQLTKLTSLALNGCEGGGITDGVLDGLTNLQHVNISYNQYFTDEVLSDLPYLTSLIAEDPSPRFTDDVFVPVPQLRSLDISFGRHFGDAVLWNLTNLHTLNIDGCQLLGDAALCRLTNLTDLSMKGCPQPSFTDTVFATLGQLTRLRITNCTQFTGQALVCLTNLVDLNVGGCSAFRSAVLGSMHQLHKLIADECPQIPLAAVRHLVQLTRLSLEDGDPATVFEALPNLHTFLTRGPRPRQRGCHLDCHYRPTSS